MVEQVIIEVESGYYKFASLDRPELVDTRVDELLDPITNKRVVTEIKNAYLQALKKRNQQPSL